jgi:predicted GNAT superfamily acetyltransferase
VKYALRPCRTRDEFAACVALQKRIWGYPDSETYPLRFFVNLHRNAGQVLGAFAPQGDLVAFLAAMPAWRHGRRYLYSLSLGVLPEHENRGLGRALKLAQRRAALRAGVEWIEWTFDPLQAKNAFFNFERLGAIARRYEADYYGPVGSRLQQGRPTDRLICEWWLRSGRVKRAVRGVPARNPNSRPTAEVAIPGNIRALAAHRVAALAEQFRVRRELEKHLRRGLVVTGFARQENIGKYLLEPPTAALFPPWAR